MFRTTCIAISLLALAGQAQAQSSQSQSTSVPSSAAVSPYVPGYYGYSSTAQEGIEHGYADVLRAEGELAYNLARAADQFETGREKWLNNRQQAVQQYFARREMNKQYQAAQRAKPAKHARLATVSHPSVPSPVTVDGRIEWPAPLAAPACATSRGQLDRLFARRAAGSEIRQGSSECRQAVRAIDALAAELKGSIDTLSASDYMAAKTMLQTLKHELAQPVEASLVAQND